MFSTSLPVGGSQPAADGSSPPVRGVQHEKRHWGFSMLLLVVYLSVFHAWLLLEEDAVKLLGCVTVLALWILLQRAHRTGCFVNSWDKRLHQVVILDVLVETFIPLHEGYGFYLCALAFSVVIGGYRGWVLCHAKSSPVSPYRCIWR